MVPNAGKQMITNDYKQMITNDYKQMITKPCKKSPKAGNYEVNMSAALQKTCRAISLLNTFLFLFFKHMVKFLH